MSTVSATPVPSPNSAVTIGRPIASTDPNAINKMMTAASNPSASLSGISNLENMSPPYSTVSPWTCTSLPRSSILVPRSTTSWYSRSRTCSSANAIGFVLLTCAAPCGSYGLVTLTPSSWSTFANRPSIADCTCGSSTPCVGLEHDLRVEPGAIRVRRFQLPLHVARLAVGQLHVGAVVRARRCRWPRR